MRDATAQSFASSVLPSTILCCTQIHNQWQSRVFSQRLSGALQHASDPDHLPFPAASPACRHAASSCETNIASCAGRCDPPQDSAGALQSVCGCANLTEVTLQSYTKLTWLSYFVGLNFIRGPLTLSSDSALSSLAGLEVGASPSSCHHFHNKWYWSKHEWMHTTMQTSRTEVCEKGWEMCMQCVLQEDS